jgi:flagellar basal body rod protein FlgB
MPTPAVSVVDQISASMSITSMRNQVIASNISSRDAQGYQRMKLSFDRALSGEHKASVVPDKANAGASVEQDLIDLSTNALHYEAMARVLTRYFSMIGAIANSKG